METKEIKQYLPHRYPFLYIDKVLSLKIGESIIAIKNISCNEPFFSGHFPQLPVMPGVLIVESMAQACGILGYKTLEKKPEDGSLYLLAGADNVRFKKSVVPGDQLKIFADVISEKFGIWKFNCKAEVNNELVASAVIMCADREINNDS
jgi:3-hydroxyacyl-[acyl-carrier-protein] dehydratase